MIKSHRSWWQPIVLLALVDTFLTPSLAGATPPTAQPGGLVVVASPSTEGDVPCCRHNFGPINTAATPRLEHAFTVRNDGSTALTIVRLQPSCGCTSAVLTGTGRLPALLKPGQQIPIQVSINVEPRLSGPFRKTVAVYVAQQAIPAVTLEMLATLNILTVAATPTVLDFGQTPYGKARHIPFTLRATNGVAPAVLAASLASSSPDVTLSLTPAVPQDNPGVLSGVATLSAKAHLGRLQGQVLVLSPAADAAPLAVLSIQGEVMGDIVAAPADISCNTAAGQMLTHRIILTSRTPGALRGLHVFCASRVLTVHMEDPTLPTAAALNVGLTPNAAGRHFTARILVTTANGQCLLIPVSGIPSASH